VIFADLEGALCRVDLLDQTDSFLLENCFKSENLLTKFCFQELSENKLLSLLQFTFRPPIKIRHNLFFYNIDSASNKLFLSLSLNTIFQIIFYMTKEINRLYQNHFDFYNWVISCFDISLISTRIH